MPWDRKALKKEWKEACALVCWRRDGEMDGRIKLKGKAAWPGDETALYFIVM